MKTLALIKRRHDVSRDAFRAHYEEAHAPLAIDTLLEGTRRYVRYHLREELFGEPRFDVVTAFWYQSVEHALAIMERLAGPDGEAIRRDELTFMDKPANSFFAVIEQLETGKESVDAGLRLVALVAAPAGEDTGRFVAHYEAQHLPALRGAVRDARWCLHHRVLPVSQDRPDYDVVTQLHAEGDAGVVEWAATVSGTGARVVLATVSEHESALPW
jgi:uncharacterized protein (TIGR02118 family)